MSHNFEYVTINPGDVFSVGSIPGRRERGMLIRETVFDEPDRWLTFGDGSMTCAGCVSWPTHCTSWRNAPSEGVALTQFSIHEV